jgi:hypothetical protein
MANHELPSTTPEQFGQYAQKLTENLLKRRPTRRGFIGGALAGLGIIAAGAALRPTPAKAEGAIEQGSLVDPWNEMPIVTGEVATTIESVEAVPENLYEVTSAAKNRTTPDTSSDANLSSEHKILDVGTYWLESQRDIPDENAGSGFVFSKGQAVGDGELATEETYAAQHLLAKVEDPEKVPDFLKSKPAEPIEMGQQTVDLSQIVGIGKNTGGVEGDIVKVWGPDALDTTSVTGAWKKVVETAFNQAAFGEAETVNTCQIFAVGNCSLMIHKVEGQPVRIVSRLTKEGQDVFVVTEYTDKGEATVGYMTPEGLQVAFPKDAATIAAGATAFTGDGVDELVTELNKSAKVFLPGAGEHGVYADKYDPATNQFLKGILKGKKAELTREEPVYMKEGNNYIAALMGTSADDQTEHVVYQVTWKGGEWKFVQPYEEYVQADGKKYVDQYAKDLGMNSGEVMQRLTVQTITDNNGENVEVYVDPQTEYPIFLNGPEGWQEATPGNVAELKGRVARLAGNGELLKFYGPEAKSFNGYTYPDGHWADPNSDEPMRPSEGEFDFKPADRAVQTANADGIKDVTFMHLVWGYDKTLPDWLLNSNFSRDQYMNLVLDHVRKTAEHFKGKKLTYSAANEMFGAQNPEFNFWKDRLGDPSTWVPDIVRTLNEVDPDATVFIGEYGIEMPGSTYWNPQKEAGFFELCKSMKDQGLNFEVAFQLPVYARDLAGGNLDSMAKKLQAQIAKYAALGLKVRITEFRFEDPQAASGKEKARIVKGIVEAAYGAGVTDFTFFGTPGADPKGPLYDESPDGRTIPRGQAYYAAAGAAMTP